MKSKIFITTIATALCISFTNMKVNAFSEATSSQTRAAVNEIIEKNEDLSKYSQLIASKSLSLDNQEIPLYVTFENQDEALYKFKQLFSDELYEIQKKYKLEGLSQLNYEQYEYFFNTMLEDISSDSNKYRTMLEFIDIFENTYQNNEIIAKVKLAKSKRSNEREEIKEEISYIIPSYNENLENEKSSRKSNIGIPNLTGAVNYAKKYANTPNSLYRYFNGADCTNFMSQILNNGGVAQVTSNSKYSGWWYKTGTSYSHSWTVADTFSKYMGRVKYNVSWNTFKSKLVKGSFIGKDNTGDGDVNHMAFITAISSDKKQVQIAQHSSNYLKWSNSTGWINKGKGVYYLVR